MKDMIKSILVIISILFFTTSCSPIPLPESQDPRVTKENTTRVYQPTTPSGFPIPLPESQVQEMFGRIEKDEDIDLSLVYQSLVGPQTALRADAARYLGTHGDNTSILYLIEALSDETVHVGAKYIDPGMASTRYWANDSLKKRTGMDFGFAWNDSKERREETIVRWRQWYSRKCDVKLHFVSTPTPRVFQDSDQVPLLKLSQFAASLKDTVIKWTIYIPDNVPVDTVIALFGQLQDAGCSNVAVYSEDEIGEWSKRDIGIEIGSKGAVRVVTQFAKKYPESLQQYTSGNHPDNLLMAKCDLGELTTILRPLLGISKRKHVRLQEVGSLNGRYVNGMPAQRYVEVLTCLKDLGVETVSFYGVYVE